MLSAPDAYLNRADPDDEDQMKNEDESRDLYDPSSVPVSKRSESDPEMLEVDTRMVEEPMILDGIEDQPIERTKFYNNNPDDDDDDMSSLEYGTSIHTF